PPEWKNQIIADLEHNKRYLSRTRTRGKSGVVRFEFNMSRSRWVLPGTRIVTINPEPRPGGAPPHSAVAAVFAAATCQASRCIVSPRGADPLREYPSSGSGAAG